MDSRRRFLYQNSIGLGGLALSQLLGAESPLLPKPPHHAAKARSCIFLTMLGGVAGQDTFDPKPALARLDGKPMDWSKQKTTDQPGLFARPRVLVQSPFAFRRHGQCGMDVSEILPHIATCVDDMAFVHSVQADNGNHPAAVFQMNTGFVVPGNPSLGAWLGFGLGTENQSLPGFVALPDFRSIPFSGAQQWGPGFLPASYQGTVMRWKGDPIRDLGAPPGLSNAEQEDRRNLLRRLNARHREMHLDHAELQARIDTYELAFRMQMEVPRTLDIAAEPAAIRSLYGLDQPVTESFGKRCLMARKLVEKGVRFVQIYTPSQSWDAHGDIRKNHLKNAQETDQPVAALLKDLKQRGLLESTLVVWMGEFGRTPDTPADQKTPGRDHNPRCMTIWFAGGGIKRGTRVGASDDIGLNAAEKPYHLRDVHATILHCMGLNHVRLTYYHAGRNRRLTDTSGELMREVLS